MKKYLLLILGLSLCSCTYNHPGKLFRVHQGDRDWLTKSYFRSNCSVWFNELETGEDVLVDGTFYVEEVKIK